MMKKRIAVITPYYKEPTEILYMAHKSVKIQDVNATVDHFMIADGFPNPEVSNWDAKHVVLPNSHGDNGNTPRGIGSYLAVAEKYDFIAYLDADNWFEPSHLSTLLQLWIETRSDVCCSSRTLHQIDGTLIDSPLDDDELNNDFADTSCFLISATAFEAIRLWIDMPKQLSPICDRVFFKGLKNKNFKFVFSGKKTLAFRSQYQGHYAKAGLPIPIGAKGDIISEVNQWLLTVEGVKETARRLGFMPF